MTTKRRPRAPRGSLSADQIVLAASDLIASGGLDKFSMPELARRLEVGVTSLYWYFRSKEELLRAIADHVTAEFYAGLDDDVGLTGDDRVLHQLRIYWRRLRDNPLWREIFLSGFVVTVSASPEARSRAGVVVQHQLERMMEAGLDAVEAADAYRLLSAYTRGLVVVRHLDTADLPSVREGERHLVTGMTGPAAAGWEAPFDDDDLFDLGLRALWAGLVAESNQRRSAERTAAPRRLPLRAARRTS